MSEPPNRKAFLLRLDPAVAAAIETMAAQELRSVKAEGRLATPRHSSRLGHSSRPGMSDVFLSQQKLPDETLDLAEVGLQQPMPAVEQVDLRIGQIA